MNRSTINSRLALSLSTLMLALLTACGGGGGSGDSQGNISGSEPPVGGTDSMALPAAVATDNNEVPQVASSDSTDQTVAAATVCGNVGPDESGISLKGFPLGSLTTRISGHDVPIRRIASPMGYSYNIDVQSLVLPMDDLRTVMDGNYTPGLTVGNMGVEMDSLFDAGFVGCINGVSRFNDNKGTETLVDDLHSWVSAMLTDLPMGLIPQTAIDGFEYTHNSASKHAVAVFRIGKDALPNTSSAQICHINAQGNVDCVVPTPTDDGSHWILKRPASASGVYVLSAAKN